MVAKKAPMKKMAAPAKTASKKMSKPAMSEDQIRKEIYRKYKLTDKSLVNQRGSAEPGKSGSVSRKEYMQTFDGVVSESSLGTGPKVAKVAMKIAAEQWDRTFGSKKGTAKKAAGKAMPASMKKK